MPSDAAEDQSPQMRAESEGTKARYSVSLAMNIKIRYKITEVVPSRRCALEIPTDRDGPLDACHTVKVPSNLGEKIRSF
jgi:hypothetical protein